MSDAREKIINDVVPKVWAEYGSLTRSADAILAALPEIVAGMVKPLVWEEVDKYALRSGLYTIRQAPFERHWHLTVGDKWLGHAPKIGHMIEGANAHHAAHILGALGL